MKNCVERTLDSFKIENRLRLGGLVGLTTLFQALIKSQLERYVVLYSNTRNMLLRRSFLKKNMQCKFTLARVADMAGTML